MNPSDNLLFLLSFYHFGKFLIFPGFTQLIATCSIVSPLLIKCSKNLINQISSCTAADNATNLASIANRAMHDCFLLLQDAASLLSKNVNPEVDFLSSKSLPQSA